MNANKVVPENLVVAINFEKFTSINIPVKLFTVP